MGGGLGGTILQAVMGSAAAGGGGMDLESILANVGGGGVGGAILRLSKVASAAFSHILTIQPNPGRFGSPPERNRPNDSAKTMPNNSAYFSLSVARRPAF